MKQMSNTYFSMEEDGKPSKLIVNSALASAQIIFGISAVVGKIGLPSFDPFTFALVRGIFSSAIMMLAAHYVAKVAGRNGGVFSGSLKEDWKIISISGLGIFLSQEFIVIGIKLSTAVAASVWQPSQPILTAAVCMIMGWEPFSIERVLGILLAFLGCSIMVLGPTIVGGGAQVNEGEIMNSVFTDLMGHLSFFVNCSGSSLYVLASKRVLATGRYESVTVTAWSTFASTCMMGIFALAMSASDTLTEFFCSDCYNGVWYIPSSAIPALIFFIVMTSCAAFGMITWANRYASSTLVIGYSVIQPMASAILIMILIIMGVEMNCAEAENGERCLVEPDKYTAIGALGVMIGLVVIVRTEPKDVDATFQNKESCHDKQQVELTVVLDEHLIAF